MQDCKNWDSEIDLAECRQFVLDNKVRVSAISLKRRPERWDKCKTFIESVLQEVYEMIELEIEFHMIEGVDGKHFELNEDYKLSDLEESHNFSLYRVWAVTEPEDLERLDPTLVQQVAIDVGAENQRLTPDQMNEPEVYLRLWRAYENLYTRHGWQRDRARHYTDFHNRHITTGEVRSAASQDSHSPDNHTSPSQ